MSMAIAFVIPGIALSWALANQGQPFRPQGMRNALRSQVELVDFMGVNPSAVQLTVKRDNANASQGLARLTVSAFQSLPTFVPLLRPLIQSILFSQARRSTGVQLRRWRSVEVGRERTFLQWASSAHWRI